MATRSNKTSHPIYRAVLHLYPKTYRQEYGDQMVQTLQDLLDEAESSLDSLAVWVRALAETPISALKENINSIGEGSMNKLVKTSNKRLIIIGAVVTAILIGFAVGIERNAIVGGSANIIYGGQIRSLVSSQSSALSNPFVGLTNQDPKLTNQCPVGPTSGIKMEIDCSVTKQTYAKLGQSSTDKTRILNAVATVTNALKAEGYQSGSNNVTLTSLIAGTYEGKDYSPDALYEKRFGKDTCTFDTLVAYSNPAQPAINMSLTCGRTLDVFGKPYQGVRYFSTH